LFVIPEGNLLLLLFVIPEGNLLLLLFVIPEGNLLLLLFVIPEGNLLLRCPKDKHAAQIRNSGASPPAYIVDGSRRSKGATLRIQDRESSHWRSAITPALSPS
jgi:hypothetical protein